MTDKRPAARAATFYERVDAFERQLLVDALEQAYGDERKARAIGLSLTTLELKLERLDVDYRAPLFNQQSLGTTDDPTAAANLVTVSLPIFFEMHIGSVEKALCHSSSIDWPTYRWQWFQRRPVGVSSSRNAAKASMLCTVTGT
jgi:hypothetical protein